MCEFISWMENSVKKYYLTSEEINSGKGKLLLENCVDNDIIGHGAIRKFYGLENIWGLIEKENQSFWDENLPLSIKKDWNEGKFDGMLKYLQNDDLQFIFSNAPEEYILWVFKNVENKLGEMKGDEDWSNRMLAYAVENKLGEMKCDEDWSNRMLAYAVENKLGEMKGDEDCDNRMLAYAVENKLGEMKGDENWRNRMLAYAVENKLGEMKGDENWSNRMLAYAVEFSRLNLKEKESIKRPVMGV